MTIRSHRASAASRGVLLAALAATLTVAHAEHVRVITDEVPVARLVKNLEKQLERDPRDRTARANLARLHAMAFATKSETARVRSGTEVLFPGYDTPRIPWRVKRAEDDEQKAAAKAHLDEAIRLYRELVKENKKEPTARLGLGWCLLKSKAKEEAAEVLRELADEAWETDKKSGHHMGDTAPLAQEAGDYLLECLDEDADKDEIKKLKKRREKLEALPRAITPVLVPLDADATLDDLLAKDATVRFDLDGRGPATWSWVTKRAGWLVLLPRDGSREVRSGLQLLGSVTWWCFWEHGYEPLAALDDDGDGELRGDELRGLGVWRDANGDGRSDPGEVRTLDEAGIEALSCRSERGERADVARWSPRGVRFRGGAVRPTWDVLLRRSAGKLQPRSAP